MSRLEKLYQGIQNLKGSGLEIPKSLRPDTTALEEEIIKEEIVPVLIRSMA